MELLLNMIVKNESGRIVRALKSCVQFIDGAVIVDTGSTDDTPAIIRTFFNTHGIPCEVVHAPFVDWSQARNEALIAARQSAIGWDYLLLMDADMELIVHDAMEFKKKRDGLSYYMEQRSGNLRYMNTRLVSRLATGVYRGVTHEYLDVPNEGTIPPAVASFHDHADGANRPDKFERDIRLLLKGLETEPNNERYYFYLAQSYRDAKDFANAAVWYKKRVAAGGWAEEQWNAQLNYAHCLKDMGDDAGFISAALVAYNMRPSRAESLYDLARYFRDKEGRQATATLFAEAGMKIPPSTDSLFVNDFVQRVGLKEEFSICGFYVPHRRWDAFKVTDELAQHSGPDGWVREGARANLYHYMPKLETVCPSFNWANINVPVEEGWAPLNPSIAMFYGILKGVLRTVNYRIDEHGSYLIRGDDESVNNTNPIKTRNFLLEWPMGCDPLVTAPVTREIIPPDNLPCEYPLVVGFEDMRLFRWRGELWTSSTVRQFSADGQCEQVLASLHPAGGHVEMDGVRQMLRVPRETEKNWSPIVDGDDLSFMWRPGTVIDRLGKFVCSNPPAFNVDNLSGSSQLVRVGGHWLALLHSARPLPGEHYKRYYYHRFVLYDVDFKVAAMSLPFVFNDKVIEFAAGMVLSGEHLLISYGYKDCEARLASVSLSEVLRFLWLLSK